MRFDTRMKWRLSFWKETNGEHRKYIGLIMVRWERQRIGDTGWKGRKLKREGSEEEMGNKQTDTHTDLSGFVAAGVRDRCE